MKTEGGVRQRPCLSGRVGTGLLHPRGGPHNLLILRLSPLPPWHGGCLSASCIRHYRKKKARENPAGEAAGFDRGYWRKLPFQVASEDVGAD